MNDELPGLKIVLVRLAVNIDPSSNVAAAASTSWCVSDKPRH